MTDDNNPNSYQISNVEFHGMLNGTQTTWGESEESHKRHASILVGFSVTLSVSIIGIFFMQANWKDGHPSSNQILSSLIVGLICGTVALLLSVAIPWMLTRRKYMANQNARIAEQLKTQQELRHEALEKLRKTTELATLMELNQGQIDTYHRIVTQQADKSFRSSRMAMNIGMFLLVCAAIAVTYVPLDQVRWFIGALAAFSTVLSGYLTKTYLAMYKESIGQLNRYFDQPVLNSFYLTAERLTAGLDSEHAQDVRCQIINEVLSTSARRGSRVVEPDEAAPKPRPKKRATRKRTSTVNGTPQA
ncbi:hypothetical protein [Streptomyces sp. DSM 118148]|uniref:hypothetical protein n=1 Tax=Streptomyces sp. DSM 118148 TaxID=3448667 RepID=UPI00403FFEDB